MIRKGKVEEAADSLSKLSTASLRDGDHLFFSALIEPDGERSAKLAEAALSASVSPIYLEEIYILLSQYHFMKGNLRRLAELVTEYRSRWEDGKALKQMLRYAAYIDERNESYDNSIRQLDRYLMFFSDDDDRRWAEVDKARVMTRFGKPVAAKELVRKLTTESNGPAVAAALYFLATESARSKDIDKAVFYHSMLRERFPYAVGLRGLVRRLSSLGDSAPVAPGPSPAGSYAIQVGVFSDKGNARRAQDRFRDMGHEAEIADKQVGGKNYHAVYVGRFTKRDEAVTFKLMLELQENEVYQVVAR
jgi:hypothetical protein